MGHKKRSHNHHAQKHRARAGAPPLPAPVVAPERKPLIQYGKPFTLLEDESKNTFEYQTGSWIPYAMTIAECRQQNCQVKELAQKVNRMTRYEVRLPITS
jgi:hypothetical protein